MIKSTRNIGHQFGVTDLGVFGDSRRSNPHRSELEDVRNPHVSAVLHDGPAWPCTGAFYPCICRHHREASVPVGVMT
jgi:hypothetical protein